MNTAIEIKLVFNPNLLTPVERACGAAGSRKLITNISQDVVVAWQRNFLRLQARPKQSFSSPNRIPYSFYKVRKSRKGDADPKMKVKPSVEPSTATGSTGFWSGAAQATSYAVQTDYLSIVSVNKIGVRLRYLGGTVKMKDKLLAIPAIPEAAGTNPEDWAGLKFCPWLHGPKTVGALVDEETGTVVWWLAETTTHEPDPTVVDLVATQAAVDNRVKEWLRQLGADLNAQNQGGN